MSSLIGKTVNIKEPSLIEFFYPNFEKKGFLAFDQDNDILFVGKAMKSHIDTLTFGTNSFINTVGVYDIDLDDRNTLLEFVYGKFGKIPKESVYDIVSSMSESDFIVYIKKYWVMGSSKVDEDCGYSVYNLYKCLGNSRQDILKIYFELLSVYEPGYVLNSVISFLEKVVDLDNITVSPRYRMLLSNFKTKFETKKLKTILFKWYTLKETKEYKTLWLLMSLGRV